ncbi:MAG: transglutaminase-like domain-containing protein [Candidatus Hodarchaeales archaeon]|jgi:hypothetical protein
MNGIEKVNSWQFQHQEQLKYRTTGSPIFRIKFYHYPQYRQNVTLIQAPSDCKLQHKKLNSFFVFKRKVNPRGSISFDRIVQIEPIDQRITVSTNWGEISAIALEERQKYTESSQYWPLQSSLMDEIMNKTWFNTENMNNWVKQASLHVLDTIKIRENQKKRLGAQQAIIHGIGDCDEFTDLFITLARLRGIPSRRLTGYYITDYGNSVEGHAWAEIFSPKVSWIPVDLAMNNIGFHGINYVIRKIEEFNPDLSDYQVNVTHTSTVHHEWIRPLPKVAPID